MVWKLRLIVYFVVVVISDVMAIHRDEPTDSIRPEGVIGDTMYNNINESLMKKIKGALTPSTTSQKEPTANGAKKGANAKAGVELAVGEPLIPQRNDRKTGNADGVIIANRNMADDVSRGFPVANGPVTSAESRLVVKGIMLNLNQPVTTSPVPRSGQFQFQNSNQTTDAKTTATTRGPVSVEQTTSTTIQPSTLTTGDRTIETTTKKAINSNRAPIITKVVFPTRFKPRIKEEISQIAAGFSVDVKNEGLKVNGHAKVLSEGSSTYTANGLLAPVPLLMTTQSLTTTTLATTTGQPSTKKTTEKPMSLLDAKCLLFRRRGLPLPRACLSSNTQVWT